MHGFFVYYVSNDTDSHDPKEHFSQGVSNPELFTIVYDLLSAHASPRKPQQASRLDLFAESIAKMHATLLFRSLLHLIKLLRARSRSP